MIYMTHSNSYKRIQNIFPYARMAVKSGRGRKRREETLSFVWIEREGDGGLPFHQGLLSFFLFPVTSLMVLKTLG